MSDGNGRRTTWGYGGRTDGQPTGVAIFAPNASSSTRVTNFYYNSEDQLDLILDPEGNATLFEYWPNKGPLRVETDPQGYFVHYEYDALGRLLEAQYDTNKMESYEYTRDADSEGGLNTDVLENSFGEPGYRHRTIYRDRLGRTLSIQELIFDDYVNPFSRVYRSTNFAYHEPDPTLPDPYLVVAVTDDNQNSEEMSYTSSGNIKTYKDKAGHVTTFSYFDEFPPINPKHRNLVSTIHRPSVTVDGVLAAYDPTEFEYDFYGNLERVTDARGGEVVMVYEDDGLVSTITDRNGHTTEYVYDGDPFNNESRNLLEIRTPKGDDPSDGFRTLRFQYDDYDNVTSVKDDLDNEVVTTYDELDRPLTVTDALTRVTSYTYEGELLTEILSPPNNGSSSLGRKTTMVYYEGSNRLQEVRRDIDSLGNQQMRVGYDYTGYSELKALTRIKNGSSKSFTFSYDTVGRLIQSVDSLSGSPGVTTTAYEPFCIGQATTSARGVRRKTNFDSRCLLTQVEVGDVDPENPLEVLDARETRQWEYDELGRMVKSTQSKGPSRYGRSVFGQDRYGSQAEEKIYLFDELDRLVEMRFRVDSDPLGANDKIMTWQYDPEGNVTKMTDTEGQVTRYSYFRDNLLKEVIVERAGDPDRVFTYSYDLIGRLLEIQYPSDTEIVAKFDDGTNTPGSGWDAQGQLMHLRYEKDGTLVRRFAFTYDESGNQASQLDVTPTQAVKWEYLYDWFDRLEVVKRAQAVDVASLPGTIPIVSVYSYDASDNRVEFRVEQEDLTYRYVVDDADNLTEIHLTDGSNPEILIETLEADEDGNLLTRTNELTDEVITYRWDDFDRLIKVSSAISGVSTSTVKEHNRYDVNGIRNWKTDKNGNRSSEYTAGISTAVSRAATSSSTVPTISYISGHQLLGFEKGGEFFYFLTDALGTVRTVVDSSGAVVQSYEFDPCHGSDEMIHRRIVRYDPGAQDLRRRSFDMIHPSRGWDRTK